MLQEIVKRYHTDAIFRDLMDKDPIAVLQAENVPDELAAIVISELSIEVEVEGYIWIACEGSPERDLQKTHLGPPGKRRR